MPQQSPISFQRATKNVLIIDGNEAMQNRRAGFLDTFCCKRTENSYLHFLGHEETVPSGAADLLIEGGTIEDLCLGSA